MSLSQWTVSNNGLSYTLSTTSPLEGASSLSVSRAGDGPIVFGLTSGAAITTGRVRTLIRPRTGNVADRHDGVFAMMQSSIAFGNNAYCAAIGTAFGGSLTTTEVRLFKGTWAAGTLLQDATSGFTYALGTTMALELGWQRDADSGIVVLTIKTGTATDFSDLATKITYSDNSSPYLSGVSAGVATRMGSGAGSPAEVYFDKTQIFRV